MCPAWPKGTLSWKTLAIYTRPITQNNVHSRHCGASSERVPEVMDVPAIHPLDIRLWVGEGVLLEERPQRARLDYTATLPKAIA